MSSIVIVVVALGALGWLAVLVAAGLRGRTKDEVPPNLDPFKTDAELEGRRLDRVLSVAVILSGLLAISLPVYWLGELDRQDSFVEQFSEEAVERGYEHTLEFACGNCHGAALNGGVAGYVDARSGIAVSWIAPNLTDIFYRYDDDEVRFWLVNGRAGSPMPPWGLEGGGPMNEQQIEEVIAYLRSIQVPQSQVVAEVETSVDLALSSLAGADDSVDAQIETQNELIRTVEEAPALLAALEPLIERARSVLDEAGGVDVDEDELTDRAETELTALAEQIAAIDPSLAPLVLDPRNPASDPTGAPDRTTAATYVAALESRINSLQLTVDRQDVILGTALEGLAFLEESRAERLYDIDLQAVADATFDGNLDEATRAVGLFQSQCARCHTSGYSEGPAFTQPVGSGALGPALWDGRANVQFLDEAQMKEFLSQGSEVGQGYGVNGIGRGFMPGFGQVLAEEDLDLLIRYLRGEVLR